MVQAVIKAYCGKLERGIIQEDRHSGNWEVHSIRHP
jgi:hypothetical protein